MDIYFFTGLPNRYDYSIAFIDKYLDKQSFNKKVSIYIPDICVSEKFMHDLWSYNPHNSFISITNSNDINANYANVIIYNDDNFINFNSELLINFSQDIIQNEYFNKIIEFIDLDNLNIACGRQKYKFYKQQNFNINHKEYKKA